MEREWIHYGLHLGLPLGMALLWYRRQAGAAFLWMLAGWAIDLDHFLVSPVFDADRCSLGFHLLHSLPAIGLYFILASYPKTRWLGLGLLAHLFADTTDCLLLTSGW